MIRDDTGAEAPEPPEPEAPIMPIGPVFSLERSVPIDAAAPVPSQEPEPSVEPERSVEPEVPAALDVPAATRTPRYRGRKRRTGNRGPRQVLTLAAVAAVLVAAGLVFNLTSGSDSPSAPVAATTPVVPRGENTRVYDRFDREVPGHKLGRAETGQPWAVIGPSWSLSDHEAVVDPEEVGRRSIAVIREAGSEGTVQVRVARVAPGAGLVFRFEDFRNYWSFTAAPRAGTWNLQRVIDGELTTIGNTGTVSTADGTTIAVRFEGGEITVLIGGIEQRTFEDEALADLEGVGLIGFSDGASPVRFDDFTMNTLPDGSSAGPTTTASVDGGD